MVRAKRSQYPVPLRPTSPAPAPAPAPLAVPGHDHLQCPTGVSQDEKQSTWHHVAVPLWNKYVDDLMSQDRGSGKSAINNLRKYDDARQLVETEAGILAAQPCDTCAKKGVTCFVWADSSQAACAYCRCKGKSRCNALGALGLEKSSQGLTEDAASETAGTPQYTPAQVIMAVAQECDEVKDLIAKLREEFGGELGRLSEQVRLSSVETGKQRRLLKLAQFENSTLKAQIALLGGETEALRKELKMTKGRVEKAAALLGGFE